MSILLLAPLLAAEDCSNQASLATFPNLDADLVFTGSVDTPLKETRSYSYAVRVNTVLKGSLQQVPPHCWSKGNLLVVLRENKTCDIHLNSGEKYFFSLTIANRSLCPVLDRRSPPAALLVNNHRRVSRQLQTTVGKWSRKFSSPSQIPQWRDIIYSVSCNCSSHYLINYFATAVCRSGTVSYQPKV